MSALREILAFFSIEVEDKKLKEGDAAVTALADKLAGFGKLVAGAFSVAAITNFTNGVLQEADAMAKAAQGLGLGTRELQELEHAAGLSGVAVEGLRSSLSRLQKGAAEAAESNKGPVADAFKKLNVELKNADGSLRTTGQLFEDAAGAIGAIENPTERAGVAATLFGKQYATLLPLFAEGKDGIKKLRAEVEELGFGFDDAFLEQAQEYNDNMDRLGKAVRGFGIQTIGLVLPKLVAFADRAVRITKAIVQWVKQSSILQSAMIVLGAAGAFALRPWIASMTALLRRFALIGAGIALAVLLVDELITTFRGGDTLIRRFIDSMFGVGTTTRIVEELKAIWDDFVAVLPHAVAVIRDVFTAMTEVVRLGVGFWIATFEEAFNFWSSAFAALPEPLKEALTVITDLFASAFGWIGSQIDSLLDRFNPLKDLFNFIDSDANEDARARRRAEDASGAPSVGRPPLRLGAPAAVTAPMAAGGGSSTANVQQSVTVNVPPGTPGGVARAAGAAAAAGQRKANRGTMNALSFRPSPKPA